MKDLTIFILGHDENQIKRTQDLLPGKSFSINLENLNLSKYPEKYATKFLSENRFFLCDWNIETEYVGFIPASWPDKFKRFNLEKVPSKVIQCIEPNTVIAPIVSDKWVAESEEFHPGMTPHLKELASFMNYKNWTSKSLWCNTFFCHKSTYESFLKDWRLMFGYLNNKYEMNFSYSCEADYLDEERKPAYLLERATMMFFAENSFDIEELCLEIMFL
jgi:hypothetical protein